MRGMARSGKTHVFLYKERFLRSGGRQHAVMIGECEDWLAPGRLTSYSTRSGWLKTSNLLGPDEGLHGIGRGFEGPAAHVFGFEGFE